MKKKAILRKKIMKLLESFQGDEKSEQTGLILEQLKGSEVWKKADSIGLYMAEPLEFDLSQLFQDSNKKILIPKTLPGRKMIFAAYEPEHVQRSSFGILEPMSEVALKPDLILVPGLAWNEAGYRVGFGGGYYDRYLADFDGATASVLYDFQLTDIPVEPHDIAVQSLFTTPRI